MKGNGNNSASYHRMKPLPSKRRRILYAVVGAALICLLCLIFFMFAHSYKSLQEAILQERIDYVGEISAQILTSQLFMENEYSEGAANLANILSGENIASLDEMHEYIVSKDRGEVLLVSRDNKIIDLSGKRISMPNDDLILGMLDSAGVTNLFTSLNYAEDSWLFSVPIAPKTIEGTTYKAVILAVSAEEFRDNMTISLFNDQGASYIINNDGRIKIKPLDDSLAFNGFNLFSSMISQGAAEEDIAKLEGDLRRGESGSNLIKVGQLDWLMGYTPLDRETSIIVAIPLTVTAAQTYEGLSSTIVFATLSVIVVALIGILLILQFFRRYRLREKEALALAAKSEFFSKMSHDIRTPLNAVIGLVELAKDASEDSTVKDYLAQSSSAAKYLLSIVNDVLDASRIESGKLIIAGSPFDMNGLLRDVRSVVAPLAAEKELIFTVESQSSFITEYIGDRVRIEQVLTNLLSNATKFTKPGGRIGLKVTSLSRPDGYDLLTMEVFDNGIGMSEEFLSRIFVPFEQEYSSYTQQYAGSGLGLSIVHSLVKLMGGTIEVSSRQGEGSVFTVQLPLRRGVNLVSRVRPPKQKALSYEGRRILLAEDNEVNQIVAAKLLSTRFAIESDIAPDGQVAVRMFADSPPGTYDLVLMDVKMPNMDGLEATRAIRSLSHPDAEKIPIVALSANAYIEDMELSIAAGMNEHLSKPLNIEALAAVFQTYFQ